MITLKNILEGVTEAPQKTPEVTSELSGMMGSSPTTWDTPKAFAPAGAPVHTNEEAALERKKLSLDEKKKLLNMVGKFNEYRRAMKMADELKQVAENILYISELTEKYGMNETSEWFEGVTLERDMKDIRRYASELHKIANKVHPEVQKAEALYEEIGLKLERYFNL
jgi:hypothetical protein